MIPAGRRARAALRGQAASRVRAAFRVANTVPVRAMSAFPVAGGLTARLLATGLLAVGVASPALGSASAATGPVAPPSGPVILGQTPNGPSGLGQTPEASRGRSPRPSARPSALRPAESRLAERAVARPVARIVSPAVDGNRGWTREEMLQASPVPPGGIGASDLPASRSLAGGSGRPDRSAHASATPASVETVTDPSLPGFRTNGRIFFRLGEKNWTCSGTAVSSGLRNVVLTAGHCVLEPASAPDAGDARWATDLIFVPGYSAATAPQGPFGQYAARELVTTAGWSRERRYSYDVAAISLDRPVEDATGGRRIAFDAELRQRSVQIYGYPADPAPQFDGGSLARCLPVSIGFDLRMTEPLPYQAGPCDLGAGASGGGWILDNRYLVSVTSYSYCSKDEPPVCEDNRFGPQLGRAALNVYTKDSIGGSAPPTVRVVKRPPVRVRKRAVNFRVAGNGSTLIDRFRVRLDRQDRVDTGPVIKIRELTLGRHVLRIRSLDQTGRLSPVTLKRVFRVLPKKR